MLTRDTVVAGAAGGIGQVGFLPSVCAELLALETNKQQIASLFAAQAFPAR